MPNNDPASVPAQPQPNSIPFNVSGARAAGYGDDEIVNELQQSGKIPYDFSGAQKAGYNPTEILNYLSPEDAQPSGYVDQAKQGVSDVLSGVGKTLDVHSTPGGFVNGAGKYLESLGTNAAPDNFVPANLTGKKGKMSNLGLWLARQGPATGTALGGAVLAAMTAPEDLIAGGTAATLGAGAAGFGMTAGNEAQTAADNRTGQPNSPVTNPDLVRGDLTAGAESAIGALPVTRYLPEAGVLAKTGAAGAISALKKLGITAGAQGAASAAADVAHQVGQSVGTPSGLNVDPNEAVGAGIGGAAMGGLLGGPKTARSSLDAIKYSEITPDLHPAATQVANRVVQNADDANLQGSLIRSGGAQRAGEAAVQKTGLDINNELGAAVSDLRSRMDLPVDADNVLRAAMGGQQPTQSGYASLEAAIVNDPQGANVLNLVRQSHAFDVLNSSGHHINGKFTGGLGGTFRNLLSGEHVAKSALVGVGAAAFEGGAGHLIAYSPQLMATAAGGAALARMLDNATGAQAPAGRFVRNFASPDAGVRLNGPAAAQPQPVASAQSPFPVRPIAGGAGTTPMLPPSVQAEITARAKLAKIVQPKPQFPTRPVAGGSMLPPAVKAEMGARARVAKVQQPAATPSQFPIRPVAGGSMLPPAIQAEIAARAKLARVTQPAVSEAAPTAVNATANGANTTTPAPTSISKAADGTVTANTGTGKRPVAPYSALPTREAAQRILNDRLAAGIPIENEATYLAKIHGVLGALREKLSAVTKEAPSIPPTELARFEGVRSQQSAAQWRDKLAAEYPAAASVLNKVFSNEAIATQWNAKR